MQIRKVLLVDDDPAVRRVAEISLTRLGKWEVLCASSGMEALATVSDFAPDVILLDVMMPGLDGMTTFKMLQQRYDGTLTPVIFLTAKVQKHEVENYTKMGAAGVITKPFDPAKLPESIVDILSGVISSTWM